MTPTVTWYLGEVITNSTQSKPSTDGLRYVSADIPVSSQLSRVPPNLCQVSFATPAKVPVGQASNAPSFTSYCNVTKL